jgi:hypothetical protein
MNMSEQTANRAKWQLLVEEQEKSGQTQTEFCKQRNVSAVKFSYYRNIFKIKNKALPQENLFSAIQIKKPELKVSAEIKIVLPNGFQCFIPDSTDVAQVKRLMEALLSC